MPVHARKSFTLFILTHNIGRNKNSPDHSHTHGLAYGPNYAFLCDLKQHLYSYQ